MLHKTLDPVWDQALEFPGTLQAFISHGLLLRVMDWDMLMFDEPLGDLKVARMPFTRAHAARRSRAHTAP